MMKNSRKYYNNSNHLVTPCQLQTEGAAYRRAESGIRKGGETKSILNNVWW